MNHFFSKVRQNYGDMKLASKFTLVLMITVTVPVNNTNFLPSHG
jgi:two-component system sensor histidine kinase YesM